MKTENYSIIELLHLSFVIRDSLEYCHEPLKLKENAFESRKKMVQQLLEKDHFIAKFLVENPNEAGKKYYESLTIYFNNIYEKEFYVSFENYKVDPDKKLEFLEETIKNYQTVLDIIHGFVKTLQDKELLDDVVLQCVNDSENFFRVLYLFIVYNEIIKEDSNYKETLQKTRDNNSYENKYILNLLKGLIAAYNFNRQKYSGQEETLKTLFEEVFKTFQKLDGSIKLTQPNEMQETLLATNRLIAQALRTYETNWRTSYKNLIQKMRENTPANTNETKS